MDRAVRDAEMTVPAVEAPAVAVPAVEAQAVVPAVGVPAVEARGVEVQAAAVPAVAVQRVVGRLAEVLAVGVLVVALPKIVTLPLPVPRLRAMAGPRIAAPKILGVAARADLPAAAHPPLKATASRRGAAQFPSVSAVIPIRCVKTSLPEFLASIRVEEKPSSEQVSPA